MSVPAPEPSNWVYYLTSTALLISMLGCYEFGVWLRAIFDPPESQISFRNMMLGTFPLAVLTVAWYGPYALDNLEKAKHVVFAGAGMFGYVIFMGMLSLDTLDRILVKRGSAKKRQSVPKLPPNTDTD
jgi:hypothetical protein